jgi:DNA-binding NarL/FixJ family response regulator
VSRRYEARQYSASGVSLRSPKIGEIQDVSLRDVCNDLPVATTVLIVDDHPSFRRFARQILQVAGFAVVDEADDGASAIAAVKRLQPDVVLLDVLLPDTTGFELAEALAAEPSSPIVILTSSRTAAELDGALARSSARGFIAKRDLSGAAFAALVAEAA